MTDEAHKWTDREIAALERRIKGIYQDASRDTQEKLNRFIAKFRRDEAKYKQELKDGKITEATYRDWLAGQVFTGKRWRAQLADLTATMTRSNDLAMQMVNKATPEAFAYNANWASFQLEHGAGINMGFGLYDSHAVTRLIRDDPKLLPPSRVDIPKDKRWNMTAISTQITQGIIQGEGLDTIAKRLQNVAAMNFNSARTHARTAMTGAQNAGRVESYKDAQEMGIRVKQQWLATLDGHTRESHARIDGESVEVGEKFSNGCRYPGDPEGRPAEVYNCRCTLIADLIDYPSEGAQRRDNETGEVIGDMTFKEWREWKAGQGNSGKDDTSSLKRAIIKVVNGQAEQTGAVNIPEKLFDRKSRIYTGDEDLREVNPKYETGEWGWRNNCQRCVPTYEMRRRGFKVTAQACPSKNDQIMADFTSAWTNRERIWCFDGNGKIQIEERMEKWGDGARAEVNVSWKNGGAHVFIAEQVNGTTRYYDPQNGSSDASPYFDECLESGTCILRIDNNAPSELISECCVNGGD